MKVLVTGGAGFIGFHVSRALLDRGDSVVIVDNFNQYYDPKLKEARAKELSSYENLEIVRADISDYNAMEAVFLKHKFDKVCHLAAQAGVRYSLTDPFVYEKSNGLGTLNMLELCRKYGPKDFVFASSSSVYGKNKKMPFSEDDAVDTPISIYAATKKYNELKAHAYHNLYGLNCTGLRFFTVYGPWGRPDMALFLFTKGILEGKQIDIFNHGNMKRNFSYIGDVTAGVVSAIDKSYPYEIINIGGKDQVLLMDFVREIENRLGKKAKLNLLPMQKGDVPSTHADISKAARLLGFEPKTSVKEGVGKFIEWYKEYYKVEDE